MEIIERRWMTFIEAIWAGGRDTLDVEAGSDTLTF